MNTYLTEKPATDRRGPNIKAKTPKEAQRKAPKGTVVVGRKTG